ncbi:MAG TPA: hypothetical protein VHC22_33965 [Pirellulales bacterium]|nr:hypothetical protein [Pirellulales bacterium]
MRFIDYFETIYVREKLAGSKKTNLKQYRIIVRAFLRKYGADVLCSDITPAMVDEFE